MSNNSCHVEFQDFDTDAYYNRYPDLQKACKDLTGPKKHLFLYNHYVKHGQYEHRVFQRRSNSVGGQNLSLTPANLRNLPRGSVDTLFKARVDAEPEFGARIGQYKTDYDQVINFDRRKDKSKEEKFDWDEVKKKSKCHYNHRDLNPKSLKPLEFDRHLGIKWCKS